MRKWMSERFKRRKKAESAPAEPAAAPLQPKYYDPQTSPEQNEPSAQPETAAPDAGASEMDEAPPATQSDGGDGNLDPRRKRRRRGRGGRGRSGSRVAPAPSAAPIVPAAPAPPVPSAPPKGVVVLAIGLPGSGKSSWFKRHNISPLSSDLLRTLLFDDATEQRFQDLVFSNLRSMLKARLIAKRPMSYVDATNLTAQDRSSWIKLAQDYGYEVQAVYFDVPVEVCLERNRKRERSVPEDIMRRMSSKLSAPTFDEGFSKITVVKVKKKDNVET